MQLTKRDENCGYHASSKAIGTDVIVGGKNIAADKFVPSINMSFHPTPEYPDGEFYFDLNHIDSPMTGRDDILANGKVIHECVNPLGQRFNHEFYTSDDNTFKWDMLFDSPAETPDTIRFRIKASKELNFYKQIMTAEQIADGNEHVVPEAEGSYAVYIDGKRNGKYQTGKVAHIYSPFYIDENGERSPLLNMDITPDGDNAKMLILTDTPEVAAWKNDPIRAGHKLRLDPILGYDTVGAFATSTLAPGAALSYHAISDGDGGEISNIHIAIFDAGTGEIKLAVLNIDQITYNPDGQIVVGATDSLIPSVTDDFSVPLSGGILPDTFYGMAIASNSNSFLFKYDNIAGRARWGDFSTAYVNKFDSPLTNNWAATVAGTRGSIWADFEAITNGLSRSGQVTPAGIKKSFGARGSQFNKPPGIKGAFR